MLAARDRERRIPAVMHRRRWSVCAWLVVCAGFAGCATMRREAPNPDLRPCTDGYAYTADGWRLVQAWPYPAGIAHWRFAALLARAPLCAMQPSH